MLSIDMINETQNAYEIISPEKSLSLILEKIKTEIEETTKHLTMKEKIMKEMYENSICFVSEKCRFFSGIRAREQAANILLQLHISIT